jgi:hypothetical protein
MTDLNSIANILNEMAYNENNVITFPDSQDACDWVRGLAGECLKSLNSNSAFKKLLSQYAEHIKKLIRDDVVPDKSKLVITPIVEKIVKYVDQSIVRITFTGNFEEYLNTDTIGRMELYFYYELNRMDHPIIGAVIDDAFISNLYNNYRKKEYYYTDDKKLQLEGTTILIKMRKILADVYYEQFKKKMKTPPKIKSEGNYGYFSVSVPMKSESKPPKWKW